MEEAGRKIAALFDFDGVIMDTEPQYTIFWNEQGLKYLNRRDFGRLIKGQTLKQIYNNYFGGMDEEQKQITEKLNRYEAAMTYDYLPGVVEFLADLRSNNVGVALVTSSDNAKMENVYSAHPEIKEQFDQILTAECFTRSKPDPECFMLGMELFGVRPEDSFVFEDSFHGLQAGVSSGAYVIGLATTNSRESLTGKASYIIDDFTGMKFEKLMQLR